MVKTQAYDLQGDPLYKNVPVLTRTALDAYDRQGDPLYRDVPVPMKTTLYTEASQ